MGSKSRPPCFFTFAISCWGRRAKKSLPKMPPNMLPFTKADIWPNIGLMVTAGSSGTALANAAFASSLGRGIFIDLGAGIGSVPPPPPLNTSCGDLVRLLQQRTQLGEGRIAWIQHANKVVRSVDGVGHQHVERRVVVDLVAPKEALVGLLADSDVEPKHAFPVQVR